MTTSCCTSFCQCRTAAQAGFDRVVLSASELAGAGPEQLQALEDNLGQWNLSCRSLNDFCRLPLKLCGPEYRLEPVEDYLKLLLPRAARLGVRQIGVGAPQSRMLPAGFPRERAAEQLRQWLERAAELAGPRGIRILLEPVCKQMTNFLNHTTQVLRLVEAGGELGMVYDIYHAWMMREPPAALAAAIGRVEMVHIAHAEHGRRLLTWSSAQRYRPYADALLAGGYRGEVALECRMDGVTAEQLAECRLALGDLFSARRPRYGETDLQDLLESG